MFTVPKISVSLSVGVLEWQMQKVSLNVLDKIIVEIYKGHLKISILSKTQVTMAQESMNCLNTLLINLMTVIGTL